MAPKGLNHLAYLTWDTAATVQFYEEVLGFPLVHTVVEDKIPSAGITNQPFLHTFFDMGQGELLAFIEINGLPPEQADTSIPSWARHVAIRLDSLEALEARRQDLLAKGAKVTDVHGHGESRSIYLFDPNGVRLEFCVSQREEFTAEARRRAHALVEHTLPGYSHPNAPVPVEAH
ncbi:MAG TPA: VOC family protein [Chloroflexota bacterium]|jgi:catechol 2,3-dioxygenase-like lactoylglutathione lyase family enzyme